MASMKQPQILQLTPSTEIIFEGPFEQVVTSYLELRNPSREKVCFKVKTTAPRRYCVRPNSGIVEPDGKVRIAIMLQPIEQDNQAERSKHKFMVQSTIMGEGASLESVWSMATPDDIMDSKLRCVFQMPNSTTAPAVAATTTTTTTTTSSSSSTATPDLLAQSTPSTATTTTTISASEQRQAKASDSETDVTNRSRAELPGDSKITSSTSARANKQAEAYSRSTLATTASTASGDSTPKRSTNYQQDLNKSAASSSHNLTTSFLQPMSDDYKLVFVSLAMLIFGVILGKYII